MESLRNKVSEYGGIMLQKNLLITTFSSQLSEIKEEVLLNLKKFAEQCLHLMDVLGNKISQMSAEMRILRPQCAIVKHLKSHLA